jgi:hypothetical protein
VALANSPRTIVPLAAGLGHGGESRRTNYQTVTPPKTTNAAVPKTADLRLRRNLRARYNPLGGEADTRPVLQVPLNIPGELGR